MGKNKHVVPHKNGWAVKAEGNKQASSVHSTQKEAIKQARQEAWSNRSELFIHGKDGRIRERDSHGNDPFPPKG